MRTLTSRSLCLLVAVVLGGCSATGPLFEPAPIPATSGKAIVNVYRPDLFRGGGVSYRLFIDGTKFVNLKNNGYSRILVPPGQHTISMAIFNYWGFLPITLVITPSMAFEVEAGEWSYILVTPWFSTAVFSEQPEQTALRAIGTSRFVQPRVDEL